MVSSLAAAISDVGLDAADHRLDREHHPGLRHVVLARTWASLGGASWLGNAGRIWMRRSGWRNSRLAQGYTTDGAMLNQRCHEMCTSNDLTYNIVNFCRSDMEYYFRFLNVV